MTTHKTCISPIAFFLILPMLVGVVSCTGQPKPENAVVIYVSADRPFSEPVLLLAVTKIPLLMEISQF